MPLIAVEGADAVGKSTQTELLGAYLSKRASERGVEFRYMHLPRLAGGRFSSLLHKFLTGSLGRGVQLEPQLAALLFACDRFDARDRLVQWLAKGDVVLMDRYVASNVAYQCAKLPDSKARMELRGWIESVEYELFGMPRADVTLYFDAPMLFSKAQIALRRGRSDSEEDVYEVDEMLQRNVRLEYEQVLANASNCYTLHCGTEDGSGIGYTMREPHAIFEEVKARLGSLGL